MVRNRLTSIPLLVCLVLIVSTVFTFAASAPDDLRQIYLTQLKAKSVQLDVPQSVLDELMPLGYRYFDIRNAYVLSVLLDSSPAAVIRFKPAEQAWTSFAAQMISYKDQRQLMSALDRQGRPQSIQGIDGATIVLATKEDVLTKVCLTAPVVVSVIKAKGLAEEEILGLLTLARLRGISDEQLVQDVGLASAQPGWKDGIRSALARLDEAAGAGR